MNPEFITITTLLTVVTTLVGAMVFFMRYLITQSVPSLQAELGAMHRKLAEALALIEVLKTEIASLKAEIVDLKAGAVILQTKLTEAGIQIATLRQEIVVLNAWIRNFLSNLSAGAKSAHPSPIMDAAQEEIHPEVPETPKEHP